ncbi:phage tail tape measure protein [Microbulbifer thermotolerans]|uniref:phage tail tape measure protein n=1 Tax=Microbulbifer thermotolerans TaxID=252514 RepID=UPI00224AD6CF|nr:phage tail tape measure protein [Microbulbifer thermotolerans]MCX2834454.1 phage tail tape measure protein [Microbulbifer thermotolerans]
MKTKLEKLLFRIGVIDDKAGATISRLDAQMQKLTRRAAVGGVILGGAAAGGWALQRAISSILDPTIEVNRALGEVRSLEVRQDALRELQTTALRTSIHYGNSAAEFIRASYDIQSAIAGLQGNELAAFTEASAVLAKGTKADVGVITNYIGTMYGIFQNTAKRIGKANWVQIVAGQTATAVQIFKTTGAEMASAFSTLGAAAQTHGIELAEQMAILGQLQASMSGSEAGTKYKAFLRGIGNAQAELGLQFTDSQGRLLPMVEILERLQGRLAGLGTVAQSDLLKKAFGSDEAVALIQQLMLDTEGLAVNIQTLGKIKGMEKARQMAAEIADPFDRWKESVKAVRIVLGKEMLPVVASIVDRFTAANAKIVEWSENFPHLTKAVSGALLVIAGLVGVVITLAALGGVLQFTLAGLSGLMLIWTAATKTAIGVQWIYNGALKAGRIALLTYHLAFQPKLLAAWTLGSRAAAVSVRFLSTVLRTAGKATLLFSAALWANPITWIVAGVIALVAGLVLLIKHWDKVKAASLGFIQGLLEKWRGLRAAIEGNAFLRLLFAPLLAGVDLVSFLLRHLMRLPEWFEQFKAWLGGLDLFSAPGRAFDWLLEKWRSLRTAIEDNAFLRFLFAPLLVGADMVEILFRQLDKIPQWFEDFKNWLGKLNIFDALGSGVDWLLDKLRLIPGINRLLPKETPGASLDRRLAGTELPESVQREKASAPLGGLPQSQASAVPPGGISQQITNNQRGHYIENVNLYQPVSGSSFSDELEMSAG